MPVKKELGIEPIPGYKLIERLGGGGFGEVWKASAPGGLLKAMKFVYGDLLAAEGNDEDSRARQEKTALERIKSVRHPYILSLERVDEIEGELIITTELADRTIWDRFKESRAAEIDPQPGIPRAELLDYIQETAEALDYMFEKYKLQHLDIKPQNIFLISNHVKVADFGLVNALGERNAATVTGGVTPVYAAPETFDGFFSPYSDQYSLAIVYMELLTGQRPFTGSTIRQLILQHIKGEKDLSALTLADRRVVEKALTREYTQRFPTCLDFVRALRGTQPVSTPVQVPARSPSAVPAKEPEGIDRTQATRRFRKPSDSPPSDSPLSDSPPPDIENTEVPEPETPRVALLHQADTPPEQATSLRTAHQGLRSAETPNASPAGIGCLHPALVVGLGGLGLMTLRRLRWWLTTEVAPANALPWIRLLGLDSDERASQDGQGDRAFLSTAETAPVYLQRAAHYLKDRHGKDALETWLSDRSLYYIPRQRHGAAIRSLGRLAFLDNYRGLSRRFEAELKACLPDPDEPPATDARIGLRSHQPRIYLVANLGGNTGSGMFIDVAYVLRQMLRRFGYPQAEIVGLLLLPTPSREGPGSASLANGFAALTELENFASGRIPFTARYEGEDGKLRTFTEAGSPFHRCYLVPLPEPVGSIPESVPAAVEGIAEFLYRELATTLGQAADRLRQGTASLPGPAGRFAFRSFGLHRIYWPRHRLLEQASFRLCRRLVERWMTKKTDHLPQDLPLQVEERWEALQLRPEGVITRIQETALQNLGRDPESIFQEVLLPLREAARIAAEGTPGLDIGPMTQALQRFEELLGLPEEFTTPTAGGAEPGELEKLLETTARKLVEKYEHRLNVEIARLIEEPGYRLAGAELALKQYARLVEKHLQIQEQLAQEVHERSVVLFQRILECMENPVTNTQVTTSIWRAFSRKTPPQDDPTAVLLKLLESYPRSRFQNLILQHVNRLYVSLRGLISDQIREIGYCRTRLVELAGFLEEKDRPVPPTEQSARLLLPGNARTAAEVVQKMEQALSPQDLVDFDELAQEVLRTDFKGLVEVCMGPPGVVRNLAPNLVDLGRRFLQDRLPADSVAELLRAQPLAEEDAPRPAEASQETSGDGELRAALKQAESKALPPWERTESRELALVYLPDDPSGRHLKSLAREVVHDAIAVATDRPDEIVFLRERLDAVPGEHDSYAAAGEAYRRRLSQDSDTLHTRKDIAFTPPLLIRTG